MPFAFQNFSNLLKSGQPARSTSLMLNVVILSSAMLVGVVAQAAGSKIVNHSGVPIDELNVSAPGTNQWGPNLLEGVKEGALDHGKSLTVKGLSDGIYDFQIAAPDEAIFCTIRNVVVKNSIAVLNQKMGKACK